ncbi:MAG: type III pantothenate kinase [Planctomycetaceae bacterium]
MDTSHAALVSPLLLVDAGNTRAKLGLFDLATIEPGRLPECRHWCSLENNDAPDWSCFAPAMRHPLARLCLTGSNPARVAELTMALPQDWPAPESLPPRGKFPIGIDVDFPERVGIDRLLNAIAGNHLREPQQAAILVSSGTATTIDYLDATGTFRGGAILPGFELSAHSLHRYTALLPLIPLNGVIESPPDEVGRNTEAAMQSGLYWGHVGAVRELLRRYLHLAAAELASTPDESRHLGNLRESEAPLVLVTGGAAPLVLPHLPGNCRDEPRLALQGLALLIHHLCRQAAPASLRH